MHLAPPITRHVGTSGPSLVTRPSSRMSRRSLLLDMLERIHQLLLSARRHGVVVAQIHRVRAFAAREGLEARLVVGELGERHERRDPRAFPAARDCR